VNGSTKRRKEKVDDITIRPSCSQSTRRRKAMTHSIPMTRRTFVRAGTAVAGTVLLGTSIPPLGASASRSPDERAAGRGSPGGPCIVDSYQDALVRTARVGEVEVQRFGVVFGPGLGRHVHNEFGLSLHLESQRGTRRGRRSWTSASRPRRCSTTWIS